MTRWILGGLMCAALVVFSLGARSSGAANDQVSDEAAATIVGGQCECWSQQACGTPPGCTGQCWLPGGGDCTAKASNGYNNGSCAGTCSGGFSRDTSGCG
jgi:hypothetical protein